MAAKIRPRPAKTGQDPSRPVPDPTRGVEAVARRRKIGNAKANAKDDAATATLHARPLARGGRHAGRLPRRHARRRCAVARPSPPAAPEAETDQTLSRRAVIRFLTEGDYPPFNYLDEDNVLTGFNVDIARAVCLSWPRPATSRCGHGRS